MDNDEESMQQIMEMLVEMKASIDAFQEKLADDRKDYQDFLTRIKEEDRQANQKFLERMEAIFDDNRKERQRVYDQETANRSLKDDRKETTSQYVYPI
jgi:hypothetical protein